MRLKHQAILTLADNMLGGLCRAFEPTAYCLNGEPVVRKTFSTAKHPLPSFCSLNLFLCRVRMKSACQYCLLPDIVFLALSFHYEQGHQPFFYALDRGSVYLCEIDFRVLSCVPDLALLGNGLFGTEREYAQIRVAVTHPLACQVHIA